MHIPAFKAGVLFDVGMMKCRQAMQLAALKYKFDPLFLVHVSGWDDKKFSRSMQGFRHLLRPKDSRLGFIFSKTASITTITTRSS